MFCPCRCLKFYYELNVNIFARPKHLVCLQGIYVTEVHDGSPASKSGLRMHDKILQVGRVKCSLFTMLKD